MASNLVIVESPAKAKTIEKYLGKDFVVKSSFGHVRDLASKGMSIDIEHGFIPNYEVSPDKKKLVSELKSLAKDAETVWLATDQDREGEAISWHLKEALKLKDTSIKRITFNEITKPAILDAIEKPRAIDTNLVNAQQARRILDRIVGFELSPVLWKKVKPSLSAGRVQSVTVRLIVEREREIIDFTPVSSFKVTGYFTYKGKTIKARLDHSFKTEKEANDFVTACKSADFKINDLQKKPAKRSPAAPFTTSTLQQEASRKLGYSVARTMNLAQRLYEAGHITYMRTDSVNLSDIALSQAKNTIISNYGGDFCNPKKYKTKSSGAQEAHEAIRPTDFNVQSAGDDTGQQRLYELIWKRAIASQMSDAELERTKIYIGSNETDYTFVATGEIIKFEGFLKVYLEGSDDEHEDEDEVVLPAVTIGDNLNYQKIEAYQSFTRPPARYTEAALVRKLEELGIGRPSTYAPTISTIQKRGYVERKDVEGNERTAINIVLENNNITRKENKEVFGADRNKLIPTDIGMVVTDFLVEHFSKILDYNFTANVEKEFDDIAHGYMEWTKMLEDFYGPFHNNIEDTLENSERASGERKLGTDPESGRDVIVRIGRYGPMVQIGNADDEEKPKFASLKKNQRIDTITFEEAMDLFKLPKQLGEFEGQTVSVAIGRFGPYVRHGNSFVSIKNQDPLDVTLEDAIVLINQKREEDKNKFIAEFEHENGAIQVLNGRYGPYIKQGKKNYKIPKNVEPSEIDLPKAIEIMENQPEKKGRRKK